MNQKTILRPVITLKLHASSARIPKHLQQILFQQLEARTHPVWVEGENAQEHQQDEQALFCLSIMEQKKQCVREKGQFIIMSASNTLDTEEKKKRGRKTKQVIHLKCTN